MRTGAAVCAVLSAAALACGGAFGQSPAHDALKKEIADLKALPAVRELPPYLDAEKDFADECAKAGEGGKKVLVSIGREECARCQRFYELVRRGKVKIDPAKTAFIRLDIDNRQHREYFGGTFEVPDTRLPFVGVTDGGRTEIKECLTGSPTAERLNALVETGK